MPSVFAAASAARRGVISFLVRDRCIARTPYAPGKTRLCNNPAAGRYYCQGCMTRLEKQT